MTEELDLSEFDFHLTRPPDKAYSVFDPQNSEEADRLEEFLHVTEIESLALKEGMEVIEKESAEEGREALSESAGEPVYHWSRIYGLTKIEDAKTGVVYRFKNDGRILVFFTILLKNNRYTKGWVAFLCEGKEAEQALYRDQDAYANKWREHLEQGHMPPSGGKN